MRHLLLLCSIVAATAWGCNGATPRPRDVPVAPFAAAELPPGALDLRDGLAVRDLDDADGLQRGQLIAVRRTQPWPDDQGPAPLVAWLELTDAPDGGAAPAALLARRPDVALTDGWDAEPITQSDLVDALDKGLAPVAKGLSDTPTLGRGQVSLVTPGDVYALLDPLDDASDDDLARRTRALFRVTASDAAEATLQRIRGAALTQRGDALVHLGHQRHWPDDPPTLALVILPPWDDHRERAPLDADALADHLRDAFEVADLPLGELDVLTLSEVSDAPHALETTPWRLAEPLELDHAPAAPDADLVIYLSHTARGHVALVVETSAHPSALLSAPRLIPLDDPEALARLAEAPLDALASQARWSELLVESAAGDAPRHRALTARAWLGLGHPERALDALGELLAEGVEGADSPQPPDDTPRPPDARLTLEQATLTRLAAHLEGELGDADAAHALWATLQTDAPRAWLRAEAHLELALTADDPDTRAALLDAPPDDAPDGLRAALDLWRALDDARDLELNDFETLVLDVIARSDLSPRERGAALTHLALAAYDAGDAARADALLAQAQSELEAGFDALGGALVVQLRADLRARDDTLEAALDAGLLQLEAADLYREAERPLDAGDATLEAARLLASTLEVATVTPDELTSLAEAIRQANALFAAAARADRVADGWALSADTLLTLYDAPADALDATLAANAYARMAGDLEHIAQTEIDLALLKGQLGADDLDALLQQVREHLESARAFADLLEQPEALLTQIEALEAALEESPR